MAKKNNAQRKDGRYAVQIYLGTVDGKRKYKTVYGYTQQEVDKKANELKVAMNKGIDISTNNETFEYWAKQWLKNKATSVTPKRLQTCEGHLNHLKPLFAKIIIKINTIEVQNIINQLAQKNVTTEKPTSANTLGNVKNTASQIFQLAIDNRIMDYNPAKALKISAIVPPEKRRALTDEEQTWIKTTEHDAKCAAMIMMFSGLRRGEFDLVA